MNANEALNEFVGLIDNETMRKEVRAKLKSAFNDYVKARNQEEIQRQNKFKKQNYCHMHLPEVHYELEIIQIILNLTKNCDYNILERIGDFVGHTLNQRAREDRTHKIIEAKESINIHNDPESDSDK